jgi:hypothetical protein
MLAILRFLTSGDAAPVAYPRDALAEVNPPWLGYALASSLGIALALVLALLALEPLSGAEALPHGGPGGVAAAIACPPAYDVVAARIFERESLVAGIALLCAREQDDDAPLLESETLGTATSQATLVRCAPEQVAVGIWGATGTLVDQLSLSCARRARPTGPVEHLRGVGGSGGHGFHARCRGRLQGVVGAAGTYVDRVAPHCEESVAGGPRP